MLLLFSIDRSPITRDMGRAHWVAVAWLPRTSLRRRFVMPKGRSAKALINVFTSDDEVFDPDKQPQHAGSHVGAVACFAQRTDVFREISNN